MRLRLKKLSFPYRHKQIFMIPNRYGFLAIAIFIVFSIVAATYSNNLLFLLAFLHVSFLLVSILQTARNLRNVEVLSVHVTSGFPGEIVPVRVLLVQKTSSNKLGLTLRCQSSSIQIQELSENDQQLITLQLTLPQPRGPHFLDRIQLSTESPYGLFYSWLYFKIKAPYSVYPRPFGQSLPIESFQQGVGEFSGLKNYEVGDPLPRISWKHSSRGDQLLIKEYKESALPQFVLAWSHCPQKDPEDRLRQLARWIVDCEKNRFQYQLQLPGYQNHFDCGESHFHRSLLKLAEWKIAP